MLADSKKSPFEYWLNHQLLQRSLSSNIWSPDALTISILNDRLLQLFLYSKHTLFEDCPNIWLLRLFRGSNIGHHVGGI